MSALATGTYRTPVTLLQPIFAQDEGGEASVTLEEVGLDFAAISLAGQAEQLVAGRLEGVLTHKISLRYREDVTAGWKITTARCTFRVLAVADPDDRRREVLCLVEEEGQ